MPEAPVCPSCHVPAVLSPDSKVYGRSYGGRVWLCQSWPVCDRYVGAHDGTDRPKGVMADNATRKARIEAHRAFDELWKPWKSFKFKRVDCYKSLARYLGVAEAHIGEADFNTCERVIAWSNETKRLGKLT